MDDVDLPKTAVEKYFFSPLYVPRGAWSVVAWWESRRLLFNAGVGGAGLVSLGVAAILGPVFFPVPIEAIVTYGLTANVCYTAGSVIDLGLRRVLGVRAPAVGQALFRYGFAFGVGLSLLPIPLAIVGWVLRHL